MPNKWHEDGRAISCGFPKFSLDPTVESHYSFRVDSPATYAQRPHYVSKMIGRIKKLRKKNDHELINVLTQILEQLSKSDDSLWSGMKIDKIKPLISIEIDKLKIGQKADISKLKGFFAPTGPIQEISIDNGWGDIFISLANRFDSATLWRG